MVSSKIRGDGLKGPKYVGHNNMSGLRTKSMTRRNKGQRVKKERHIPTDFPNDMSSLKPLETLVEINVVNMIIVAFREHQLLFSW